MFESTAGPQGGNSGVQELFGCFLSLNQIPSLHEVSAALEQAKSVKAAHEDTGLQSSSDDATLLLSLALPNTPLSAISVLARLP